MTDTSTTAVAYIDDTRKSAAIAEPAAEKALIAYSSIKGEDFDSRIAILNAITNSEGLSEHMGEPLNLRNIIIQNTTLTDAETGEVIDVQRAVLITAEGKAYHATSSGVINSLRQVIGSLGEPAGWAEPIEATFREEGPKGRRYYTASFAKYKGAAPGKK